MSPLPAINAFDAASLPAAKTVACVAAEGFAELVGAVGDGIADRGGDLVNLAPTSPPSGLSGTSAAVLASLIATTARDRPRSGKSMGDEPASDGSPDETQEEQPELQVAPVAAQSAWMPFPLMSPIAAAIGAAHAQGRVASGQDLKTALPAAAPAAPVSARALDLAEAAQSTPDAVRGVTGPTGLTRETVAGATRLLPGASPADAAAGAAQARVHRDDAGRAPAMAPKKTELSLAVAGPAPAEVALPVMAGGLLIAAPAAAGMDPNAVAQDPQGIDVSISHHLDLAHEGEWLDRLASEIARTAGQSGTLRFRLHPESLGRLHVEMAQGATGASIHLVTETEAARSVIADAQPRLLAEARAQGVRIAETHVALGAGGQWSSSGQQGQRGHAGPFLRTLPEGRTGEPPASRPSLQPQGRYA